MGREPDLTGLSKQLTKQQIRCTEEVRALMDCMAVSAVVGLGVAALGRVGAVVEQLAPCTHAECVLMLQHACVFGIACRRWQARGRPCVHVSSHQFSAPQSLIDNDSGKASSTPTRAARRSGQRRSSA